MRTRPRQRLPSRRRTVPARADDEVGYGRPPREHQFKPGKGGNLRGRPKGAKSEATILRGLLNRKIDVRQDGRLRKITVFEAILLRFTEEALKGNTKSATFLFNRYAATQAEESALGDQVSDDDREILEAFVRRFEAQHRQRRDRT
jgi:Family of unknown function (DUF5681)